MTCTNRSRKVSLPSAQPPPYAARASPRWSGVDRTRPPNDSDWVRPPWSAPGEAAGLPPPRRSEVMTLLPAAAAVTGPDRDRARRPSVFGSGLGESADPAPSPPRGWPLGTGPHVPPPVPALITFDKPSAAFVTSVGP